jgi:hypothetical protein
MGAYCTVLRIFAASKATGSPSFAGWNVAWRNYEVVYVVEKRMVSGIQRVVGGSAADTETE